MALKADSKTRDTKNNEKSGYAENSREASRFSGIPNSLVHSAPLPPPAMPNSIMREMLDPGISAAEEEADRLSAGISYGSPNSVMREMGSRLGSDFSSVRFHSDPGSIRKNEAMGSRAFTQGNDIYFGKGGFEPRIAAHELVHTVQQGASRGSVSRSVAPGTVQM